MGSEMCIRDRPWSVHPYGGRGTVEAKDDVPAWDYRVVVIGAGDTIVGEASLSTLSKRYAGYPHVETDAEVFANAHLMSAAPDLYAACRGVARDMRRHVDSLRSSTGCPDLTPKQCAWADALEAAIAKAEGR